MLSSQLHPIHTMRLGVELDSFDGHHYISTINPDGPVAKHGLLRPEDELLEVKKIMYSHHMLLVLSPQVKFSPTFTFTFLHLVI